jgi:phosphoglycolate phosphatase
MPSPAPALIFDLDGTLVDTAPDLTGALNAVLLSEGHASVTLDEVRHMVGHGAVAMIRHALETAGAPPPPDEMGHLVETFLVHYRANIARLSTPFPGAVATLTKLSKAGMLMGVCTNKTHDLSELLLREIGLAHFFGAVQGVGVKPYNKPDPRHLTDVVAMLGGSVDRAVMIGDSATDVNTARAAGVPVIAMTYGYTPVPAHELGADVVLDDFAAIPAAVKKLLG